MKLLKKSNNVLHVKLIPSKTLNTFRQFLYGVSILLVLGCSLDWFFKIMLIVLFGLVYLRQNKRQHINNDLEVIEIRGNGIFVKRKNDVVFQKILQFSVKQNRIFAELELQLIDELRSEFIHYDRFSSKAQFRLLMQYLRFNHLSI